MSVSEKVSKVIEEIASWSLLDVKEFISAFEEKFDVKAQAAIAVAAGPAAAAEPVEEKTEFDVELTSFGAEKIKVIKVVREITGLGLAEAKGLVESAPTKLKEALPKADAEAIAAKIKEVGGTATIK